MNLMSFMSKLGPKELETATPGPSAPLYTESAPQFYMEKYGFGQQPHIPTCFTKCAFVPGQVIHCRVTQVYDPSKFWIVIKYQELELFQKHLFRLYYTNHAKYQVPPNKIAAFMYCVVFTDGSYYRGVIVGIPIGHHPEQEYTVYLFDFGTLATVSKSDIFYLGKRYAEVPQFVVRASLAGICPRKSPQWSTEDITEFSTAVTDKVLVGVVVNVLKDTQVLDIRIKEKNESVPVHEQLIQQGRARYFNERPEISKELVHPGGLQPKLEHAHLFPCHEAIESGKIPTSAYDAEFQMTIAPSAYILQRYYKQKDNQD